MFIRTENDEVGIRWTIALGMTRRIASYLKYLPLKCRPKIGPAAMESRDVPRVEHPERLAQSMWWNGKQNGLIAEQAHVWFCEFADPKKTQTVHDELLS